MKVSNNDSVSTFGFDLTVVWWTIFSSFILFTVLLYVYIVFTLILTVSFSRAAVR